MSDPFNTSELDPQMRRVTEELYWRLWRKGPENLEEEETLKCLARDLGIEPQEALPPRRARIRTAQYQLDNNGFPSTCWLTLKHPCEVVEELMKYHPDFNNIRKDSIPGFLRIYNPHTGVFERMKAEDARGPVVELIENIIYDEENYPDFISACLHVARAGRLLQVKDEEKIDPSDWFDQFDPKDVDYKEMQEAIESDISHPGLSSAMGTFECRWLKAPQFNSRFVAEIMEQIDIISGKLRRPVFEVNKHPGRVIGFKNGVLAHRFAKGAEEAPELGSNIGDWAFFPHDPKWELDVAFPHEIPASEGYRDEPGMVDFDSPRLNCPTWSKFLSEFLPWKGAKDILRAALKSTLTGHGQKAGYIYAFTGVAGSGKSVLQDVVVKLAGKANVHATNLELLHKDKFETSNVRDKRVLLFSEQERYAGAFHNLKSIVTGDDIRSEGKYEKSGTFKPTCTCWYFSNFEFPVDKAGALTRRTVQFLITQPAQNPDPYLLDRLDSELVGILIWVLTMDDCFMEEKVLKKPFEHCPYLKEAKKANIENENIASFIDNCLVLVRDLPQEFQDVYGKKNFAHLEVSVGGNVTEKTPFADNFPQVRSRSDAMTDPRTDKEYWQGRLVPENYNHHQGAHQFLYAAYRTHCQEVGGVEQELKAFKIALNNQLNSIGIKKGNLKATNKSGFPGITLRALLPEDLRLSTLKPVTREQPDASAEYEVEAPLPESGNLLGYPESDYKLLLL